MGKSNSETCGYQKHMNLKVRVTIEDGTKNGLNKAQIAKVINKDPTTVAKEIKNHRIISGSPCKAPHECANYKKCKHGRSCVSVRLNIHNYKIMII
ncbi:hypothetical protein SG0102_02130 [Intestinibaculum porci]|uniref:Transposase IS30-like HTH domain-containing protein n=2 Tax=Intestinibaculum porci TaxID=2487118 RepID=A0A3G9JQE9_9FIRM|nr:hypothetical protein SG0102_02130 [Intestinibaculum porci]